MSKIAVFLASGFEEIEALTVVDICRRAGITVTMVSVAGERTVEGSHGIKVLADHMFDETDIDNMDMLVLPGGMPGSRNLQAHEKLMKKVTEFYKKGKNVAAICAAPTVFGSLGILNGRKACCYPGMEDELTGASVVYDPVAVSDNVITARGMGCAIPFALAITEHFCGREKAEKLAEGIVYRS